MCTFSAKLSTTILVYKVCSYLCCCCFGGVLNSIHKLLKNLHFSTVSIIENIPRVARHLPYIRQISSNIIFFLLPHTNNYYLLIWWLALALKLVIKSFFLQFFCFLFLFEDTNTWLTCLYWKHTNTRAVTLSIFLVFYFSCYFCICCFSFPFLHFISCSFSFSLSLIDFMSPPFFFTLSTSLMVVSTD